MESGFDRLSAEFKAGLQALSTELRVEMKDFGAELRAELRAEFKTGLQGLGAELRTEMKDLGAELRAEMKDLGKELKADIKGLDSRLATVETTLRQVAVTVSGHTHDIGEIKGGLAKLATLEDIAKRTDAFLSDVLASRAERVMTDKSLREQREAMIDHELRITRLERREKPS